jgi:hypothetical protein
MWVAARSFNASKDSSSSVIEQKATIYPPALFLADMTTVLNYSAAGGPEERGHNGGLVPSYSSPFAELREGGRKTPTYLSPITPRASDLNARLWFKWRKRLLVASACGMCLGVFGVLAPTLISTVMGAEVRCALFVGSHFRPSHGGGSTHAADRLHV